MYVLGEAHKLSMTCIQIRLRQAKYLKLNVVYQFHRLFFKVFRMGPTPHNLAGLMYFISPGMNSHKTPSLLHKQCGQTKENTVSICGHKWQIAVVVDTHTG